MTSARFRGSERSRSLDSRKGLLLFVLVFVLLWLAPVLARAQSADSLVLSWTAPADAGGGAVYAYDVRYSSVSITEGNFAFGTRLIPPSPRPPGTPQRLVMHGLPGGAPLWFAVRSEDSQGNWSALSNVVRWSGLYDTSPPATPAGLQVATGSDSVRIEWTPDSAPDLAGYTVYRATDPRGGWNAIGSAGPQQDWFSDHNLPNGIAQLWYAVTAHDQSGNESGRSSPIEAQIEVTASATLWRLQSPYPNPARANELSHLPIQAPATAGDARLEILDGAGHVVRRLAIRSGASGPLLVDWDGANDHGVACAPGVYHAWLVAGRTRQVVAVARLP